MPYRKVSYLEQMWFLLRWGLRHGFRGKGENMTELELYKKCLGLGMTPAGAAGCVANIMAESAGRPDNVEDRSWMSDGTYTKRVDDGSYTGFVDDRYGYGLCQWTSPSRKQALLDYAKGHGVSIGDADMQFQFMAREMRSTYTYVWNILTHTTDPYEAGYTMCKFYEIPANTESSSQQRGYNARGIYDRCFGATPEEPEEKPQEEKFWPPRMICKGMSGPDVIVLQAILAARGYSVTAINGVFDDSTYKATRKFQEDNNLDVDGIAGPKTWAVLTKL